MELLKTLGMSNLPGVKQQQAQTGYGGFSAPAGGYSGGEFFPLNQGIDWSRVGATAHTRGQRHSLPACLSFAECNTSMMCRLCRLPFSSDFAVCTYNWRPYALAQAAAAAAATAAGERLHNRAPVEVSLWLGLREAFALPATNCEPKLEGMAAERACTTSCRVMWKGTL